VTAVRTSPGCTHQPGILTGTVNLTFFVNGGVAVYRASYANTTYTMDSGSSYRLTDAAGSTAIYVEGLPRTFKWR
jgi:hypothetical protein